ncbi:uncharacterized protein M421DRAFT_394567 [Didymella exigua CBS 183.55]|uniref:Uncharacterized protein n=1 Tax=Didymella exigua CBS 183.55 TaxID=1150837 RepID=A0A6A5RGP9_9PLEO|nr:uncharacterized protein M421DRAFT_394567 [Didymella exigua CBS 183.55]KAF1926922.1 hypothetical protein M421DRAFT_394567 [Didymella exigua CBS 183.55]
MCLEDGDVKLPTGFFEPIYQVGKHKNKSTPTFPELAAAHRLYGIGKLSNAPSPTHDFPDGNFTLAEIAAFLPQSIKSWDVADRIIWNGAASEDLALFFNKYRGLSPKIDINSVYLMFRGQMRKRSEAEHGYKNWRQWIVSAQADVQKPEKFDPDSINVTGFRRPVIFQNRLNIPAVPIPFTDLAKGVALWPEGDDALDLTRCVSWCVDHPEVESYYPTDYQTVLERVGGPLVPNACHSDGQALLRLRSGTGRIAPRRRVNRDYRYGNADSYEISDDTESRKRKRGLSSRDERAKRRKSTAASTLRQTRTTRNTTAQLPAKKDTLFQMSSEEDTDDDSYQGPKHTKKNKEGPRRSGRIKTKTASYVDIDGAEMEETDAECEYRQYGDAGDDEDVSDGELNDVDMDE